MVLEQVNFVDVEKSTVSRCEESGRERLYAINQCALDVDRSDDSILGSAER